MEYTLIVKDIKTIIINRYYYMKIVFHYIKQYSNKIVTIYVDL